MNFLPLL